jgi:hypothetical protein
MKKRLYLLAMGFWGLLLACWSVKAQPYDYYYTVDRFSDSSGDVISQYDNWYVDPSGNTHNYELPVYVGMDTGSPSLTWLKPGYGIDITDLANGGGMVVGAPFQLPVGGGSGSGGPSNASNGNTSKGHMVNKRGGTLTLQSGNFPVYVQDGNPPRQPPVPGSSPSGYYNKGATLNPGCYTFWTAPPPGAGGKGTPVSVDWTGCHVALQPAPETGQFSPIYAVLGGGASFPSANPPSFYANADWDSACMGDFDSPFDGVGYGEVVVQCDNSEFLSVETPGDTYAGCCPDAPGTLALLGLGTISLLAYDWRRRAAKA